MLGDLAVVADADLLADLRVEDLEQQWFGDEEAQQHRHREPRQQRPQPSLVWTPWVLDTSQLSRASTTQNHTAATTSATASGRSGRNVTRAMAIEAPPNRAVLTTIAPYQV